jgi:hypothetical protein
MADILPFWANALLVVGFLAILVIAFVRSRKCSRCGGWLRELTSYDPLTWRGISVNGVPRFRKVQLRCQTCGEESTHKEVITRGIGDG